MTTERSKRFGDVAPTRANRQERRLKLALMLFFVALSGPTFWLAYRAVEQAQWEVFHRYRLQAEALSAQVNSELSAMIASEDARGFADYAFLIVTANSKAAGGETSPLSTFPPPSAIPGTIGYFQIDGTGRLSTPLLPPQGRDLSEFNISDDEFVARRHAAESLRTILSSAASQVVSERGVANNDSSSADDRADEEMESYDEDDYRGNLFDRLSDVDGGQKLKSTTRSLGNVADLKLTESLQKKSRAARPKTLPPAPVAAYAKRESRKEQVAVLEIESAAKADYAAQAAAGSGASEIDELLSADAVPANAPAPITLRERSAQRADTEAFSALPAQRSAAKPQLTASEDAKQSRQIGPQSTPGQRVRLFESEVDPMNLRRLDSEHFVLFRNVWRGGERFVQGLVIEQSAFIEGAVRQLWRASPLATVSNLLIAWQDEVLAVESQLAAHKTSNGTAPGGELLYRTRLSAPLSELELVYSLTRLPRATSASYLLWVTVIMVTILALGCWMMFSFGRGQLRLYRQQQDFVSAVSHELKTPLTSIRMYAEILTAGWADEEKRKTYYAYIHDESERLSRLINNVLQLARITQGQMHLEVKPVQVSELVSLVESRLDSQLEPAGFSLDKDLSPAAYTCSVEVDVDAVIQILINFVDNAIKFTPKDCEKRVVLGCSLVDQNHIQISVRDFGHGVARDQMRRIFDLFYRAENELTRDTVGTGIGLALVDQMARAMNAKVNVRNRQPGAEFSFIVACIKDP